MSVQKYVWLWFWRMGAPLHMRKYYVKLITHLVSTQLWKERRLHWRQYLWISPSAGIFKGRVWMSKDWDGHPMFVDRRILSKKKDIVIQLEYSVDICPDIGSEDGIILQLVKSRTRWNDLIIDWRRV